LLVSGSKKKIIGHITIAFFGWKSPRRLVRLQPIRHWNCWQWLWRCCKVNRWRQWRHLLLNPWAAFVS
jgi:hypothetical protein